MGMLAATKLLASIEDANLQPSRISILPELVIRQSSAACPRG
jgi:DNA-binding LacI/PurR family transcriptional regulator